MVAALADFEKGDFTPRETLALAPLILMIFAIGLFPSVFLDRMKASVDLAYNQFKFVSGQAVQFSDDKDAQILPTEDFDPAFLKGSPDTPKDKEPGAEEKPSGEQAALDRAKGAQ